MTVDLLAIDNAILMVVPLAHIKLTSNDSAAATNWENLDL